MIVVRIATIGASTVNPRRMESWNGDNENHPIKYHRNHWLKKMQKHSLEVQLLWKRPILFTTKFQA